MCAQNVICNADVNETGGNMHPAYEIAQCLLMEKISIFLNVYLFITIEKSNGKSFCIQKIEFN